jgi:hypothetical protein
LSMRYISSLLPENVMRAAALEMSLLCLPPIKQSLTPCPDLVGLWAALDPRSLPSRLPDGSTRSLC